MNHFVKGMHLITIIVAFTQYLRLNVVFLFLLSLTVLNNFGMYVDLSCTVHNYIISIHLRKPIKTFRHLCILGEFLPFCSKICQINLPFLF